jgi:tetratricopeptide (TPR) repeat protein
VFLKNQIFSQNTSSSGLPNTNSLSSKSVKNPIFEETSHNAIRLAHKRRNRNLLIAASVVLTIAGIYTATKMQSSRQASLTQEFLRAENKFISELEEFQTSVASQGEKFDFSKTPNHDKSTEEFLKFAEKHPSHPLSWQAKLRVGNYFIEKKKFKEALPILENLASKMISNNIAQSRIRRSLATVHAALENYPAALKELEFAEKLPNNPNLNETKLLKAQILHISGKKEEAATILKELTSVAGSDQEFSGRSVATEAALWLSHWKL